MDRIRKFIRQERLYILLLILVILMNIGVASSSRVKQKTGERVVTFSKQLIPKTFDVEKLLREKRPLVIIMNLLSLLFIVGLLLGIIIDINLLLRRRATGRFPDIHTYELKTVRWNIWDVVKVVTLFLFFGYGIVIIESFYAKIFPILKNDNLRVMLNSSVLDVLSAICILYFVMHEHKETMISLGLSLKNFLKNIFYGIIGYIALIPILLGILIAISVVTNLMKYTPEQQLVVELFLKEKNNMFLVYISIFASIIGPIVEETFFRGFMYNAFRKTIGIFWATLFTAAVFAGLHASPVGFLPIMALGVLLTYLYEKTGTLISPITVHVIHNFSMVGLVFLVKALKG